MDGDPARTSLMWHSLQHQCLALTEKAVGMDTCRQGRRTVHETHVHACWVAHTTLCCWASAGVLANTAPKPGACGTVLQAEPACMGLTDERLQRIIAPSSAQHGLLSGFSVKAAPPDVAKAREAGRLVMQTAPACMWSRATHQHPMAR
jgi:hypothetical protein